MPLLGCSNETENGALVDLSGHLGGWVSIIGYVFSLLALATSFWANTLNLRDIVNEQTKWGEKISWLAATLPCLVIALVGVQSFVGFTRMASVVQVLTGVGVIVAYNRSRKRAGTSLICGRLGSLPFQILAVAASLVASVADAASLITQASTTIQLPALIRPLRPNTKLMLDAVLLRGVLPEKQRNHTKE